jgi:hypothetical protein
MRASPAVPTRPLSAGGRASRLVGRASHEDHLVALLLKHRAICATILPAVVAEDIMDSRNRELLRVLRDPEMPLDLPPEQVLRQAQDAGLDDAVTDHAERLLASLEGKPAQYPGQIERDAQQARERLGKERFDYLMRQLQAGIQAAQQADDQESLLSLSGQMALLYERHRQFYPPPSPYFRDSRDSLAPRR